MAYGSSQARGPIRAIAASLHHSSRQHWILNPLSKAGDQTRDLMVPSGIRFRCAMTGTPKSPLEFAVLLGILVVGDILDVYQL